MPLRFGVLGTGYWAQEAHATALAASDQADLVAIWGRDPARVKTERFGPTGVP
jgi:predicted dehydrogenase